MVSASTTPPATNCLLSTFRRLSKIEEGLLAALLAAWDAVELAVEAARLKIVLGDFAILTSGCA